MPRVLSCIQPTGDVHLGNYLGALRGWVAGQHECDAFHGIVDLHALTFPQDPAVLRAKTLELATILFAIGLDPDVATIFVQSHVPEHTRLCWLMECNVAVGELERMTQYKDKSTRQTGELVSAGLLMYPALQAADILVYDANEVPVGEDQRQHIELTRDIATRFNHRYGETFVIPEATIPKTGARVMDLQQPTKKMSKSVEGQGGVGILEPAETIVRKFRRAVTDSDNEVRYDRAQKPGVSNLLEILGVLTDRTPERVAESYTQYGPLKTDAGEAVVELTRPLRERVAELSRDPGTVAALLAKGAEKARRIASVTLARAEHNIGLLPPG
jgi:tryptophanyl-tRNA synthetase